LPRLSPNDKGDNGMMPRAVRRSPDIYRTAEENFRKSQLGDCHEGCAWGLIPPNEVSRIAQPVRKGEGRGRWKGRMNSIIFRTPQTSLKVIWCFRLSNIS
jgi:hypothetical protein